AHRSDPVCIRLDDAACSTLRLVSGWGLGGEFWSVHDQDRGGDSVALGEGHAQSEAEVLELALDLTQRGATEGPDLEEVGLGLDDELGDGLDTRVLQAVGGPDGEVQVADGHGELADEV